MQNTVETKKVGAGIITMSILYLLGQAITILGCLVNIFLKDEISKNLQLMGISSEVNTVQILISLVISLIITIAVILILFKKPIGAYLFIGIEILSFIYGSISSGVNIFSFILLIFPALMILFIYKKKDIYFVSEELEN